MGPDRFHATVEAPASGDPSRPRPPRTVPGIPIPVPAIPVPVPSIAVPETPPIARSRAASHRWLVEWLAVLGVALVLAVAVRTYTVQLFYIPSGSMLPTLQVGDRIVVDKLAYRFESVRRGDIVVFGRPPLEQADYQDLVKRVIGLPGDTLSLVGGRVFVDGRPLAEPWLRPPAPPTTPSPLEATFSLAHPFTVPSGEYFVMGDDRTDSEDSRYFGPISKNLVVGKMSFVIWPLGDGGWLVVLSLAAGTLLVALAVLHRPPRRTGVRPEPG